MSTTKRSPAAAAATLRSKLQAISADSPEEVDEITRPLVFDDDSDDSSETSDVVAGADIADLEEDESASNRGPSAHFRDGPRLDALPAPCE